MERAIKTDLTDRFQYEFAGSTEPKTLRMQNSDGATAIYVKFKADDAVVPSASDFDVIVPPAGVVIELKEFSCKVIISSYTPGLSVLRY